jgi:hypothetical protein
VSDNWRMEPRRELAPAGKRRGGVGHAPVPSPKPAEPVVSPAPKPIAGAKTPVRSVLAMQRAAGNAAVVEALAPVQRAPKAPRKAATGVAKYGTTRLTDRLNDMMKRGVLGVAGAPATLDRDQLFLLQGVANVETGGADNAVYTKDNMYVSLGFKQVTLGWGSLYEIMKAAPSAFAKHGIVLGSGSYTLKGETRPAIEGAPDPAVLKMPPWTDRFYDAGSEDEVVSAMVWFTLKELSRMEKRFASDSPGKANPWMKDPTARAWLLETMNNRPAYAYAAAKGTLARTSGQQMTRDAFLAVLESEIVGVYESKGEGNKGGHIIAKIPRSGPTGATPPGPGPSVPVPSAPASPAPTSVPAKAAPTKAAAGADLIPKAAAVLPGAAAEPGAAALLQLIVAAGLLGPAIRLLAAAGHTDTNALTNIAFWGAHPELFGKKLQPSQPGFAGLAAEWMRLRDGIVAESRSTAGTPAPAKQAAAVPGKPVATKPPPGSVPVAEIAAQSAAVSPSGATATATGADAGDKYFVQDVGRYRDVSDSGKSAGQTRIWKYGSSGANVCNMTSLTMGLVSLAGESEVRSRMVAMLHSSGMHAGASVQVGGSFVSLEQALDEPATLARIQTLDLVTAVAIGKHGGYADVTEAGVIARVARDAGLANAEVATGKIRLTDPGVRAKAATMLAAGKRVIAGTVNHYVYLLEVRSDGVLVHDPAGARVTPGLSGALFVHTGKVNSIAHEFMNMDAGRRETALRRVSTNPAASAVINDLPAIASMSKADRAAALKQLAQAHPGTISTGARNFYATSEFAANDLRLRVTLSGTGG